MRGRWRNRKKWLAESGWTVVRDEKVDSAHRLTLRSPDGKTEELTAPNRSRAYRSAVLRFLGGEPPHAKGPQPEARP